MARDKTKTKKQLRKAAKTLLSSREAPSEGRPAMNSEPFHPDIPTDAAVIHPVTSERLDEAAHRAAQMADDVAHHVVASPVPEPVETDAVEPQPDAAPMAADAAEMAEHVAETATEAAEAVAGQAEQAAEAVVEAVGTALDEATEPARAAAGPSGGGDPVGRYNAALFGMIRTNMAATGELFAALVQARSVPEVVAINADHLRRQFDTMTTQGRELAQLAQTLTFDALKPLSGPGRRAE